MAVQHQTPQMQIKSEISVDVPSEFELADEESGLQKEDITDFVGCKKKEKVSLFFGTTPGMLA